MQHVQPVLPVSVRGDIISATERVGSVTQDFFDLLARPEIEFPFDAFTIGIFRRVKPAVGARHVAQYVVTGPPRNVRINRVARDLVRVHVTGNQLRLVVEHLLEVRHQPAFIDAVPMESTAELVEHPALAHRPQRVQRHVARLQCTWQRPFLLSSPLPLGERVRVRGSCKIPKQKIQSDRPRKLRCAAEPAVHFIITGTKLFETEPQRRIIQRAALGSVPADGRVLPNGLRDLAGLRHHGIVVRLPNVVHALEQLLDPGRPYRASGGKYVPQKNGLRSGVSHTLIGQPPEAVVACTAVI